MTGGPAPSVRDTLRDLAPRVLAAVTRRSGDFAAAEDAVQEALLAAHTEWTADALPANPGGWLYSVACRRLADRVESEAARRRREETVGVRRVEEAQPFGEPRGDDTLLLLFLCCHPALAPPSAIALTLRAVCGLTTREIARAFLVPVPTMAQRVSRAKRTIASTGASFALPGAEDLPRRLRSVMHTVYLLFNEGHTASAGDDLVRADLSSEAIRLARALHRLRPEDPEVEGLLALLLLTDARRPARTGPTGDLIPLHEQDRSLWDRRAIGEGRSLLESALPRGAAGPYQIQAAIAALHDEAPSVEATDWAQVLALYGLLERMTGNPMVALNRAVAGAMVHGPAQALSWLDALESEGRLEGHYRLDAVRAHLYERAGDPERALHHYRAAVRGTQSAAERRYLIRKAAGTRAAAHQARGQDPAT